MTAAGKKLDTMIRTTIGRKKSAGRCMRGPRSSPLRQPEWEEQCAVVAWALAMRRNPDYPEIDLLHCSLNGTKMTPAQAGRAKAAGMRSGIPDLFLPVPRSGFPGLYIEMKHGDNDVSPEQAKVIGRLRGLGYAVHVCWSAAEAIGVIKRYYGVIA